MKRIFLLTTILLSIFLVVFAVPRAKTYLERQRAITEQSHVVMPPREAALASSSSRASLTSSNSMIAAASSSSLSLRTAVNWDVPFTPQAPFALWDDLHEEACEEASVLMVLRYFQGEPIRSADDAEAAIQALVSVNATLGFSVDNTAAEIVTLLNHEDSSLQATLLRNPTEISLKQVLSEGKLVIVPAAGRQLGNPYFSPPGPLYHMLVLRGYTENGYLITNDPGTKRGQEYAYSWARLLNAIHDWNGGDVEKGEKVVIVVGK